MKRWSRLAFCTSPSRFSSHLQLVRLLMDHKEQLETYLDTLTLTLRPLASLPEQKAGKNDPFCTHLAPLLVDEDCTFEEAREAILTILGAKEDDDLRVGGRFGATSLVRVVRTLLAREELSPDGRLSEAIAWVSSVQRRVNDLWVLSFVSDEAEAC
jgi:hypothetical protein